MVLKSLLQNDCNVFIHFWESTHMWESGERETEDLKQVLHWQESPMWGSNSWTRRSWPSRSWRFTNWATQVPPPEWLYYSVKISTTGNVKHLGSRFKLQRKLRYEVIQDIIIIISQLAILSVEITKNKILTKAQDRYVFAKSKVLLYKKGPQ